MKKNQLYQVIVKRNTSFSILNYNWILEIGNKISSFFGGSAEENTVNRVQANHKI